MATVYGFTEDDTATNTRLMAAAPELLEACLAAHPVLKSWPMDSPNGMTFEAADIERRKKLELLEAAIAKATSP